MMATQSVGNPRQILTQIVQRIGDLSQALMSDQSEEVSSSDLASSNNTLEAEVRSVFTGHRANRTATGPVLNSNEAVEVQTSRAQGQLALSSTQSSSRNTRTPLYNVRRHFNNQRTAIRNRRSSHSNATATRTLPCSTPRLGRRGTIGPFSHDLILLTGPDDKNIPRQGTKLFLQENGHIINAFQFMKEWSDIEIIVQITEVFKDKIPSGVDFEILHSVHTALVTPTLASGQNLNGSVMCRIFRDNKPVYVRPSMQILPKEEHVEKESLVTNSDICEDDISNLSEMDGIEIITQVDEQNNYHNESSAISSAVQVGEVSDDHDEINVINSAIQVEPINASHDEAVIDGQTVIDGHNTEENFPQVLREWQQLGPQRERDILVPRSNLLKTMVGEFNDPRILHDIVTFMLIGDNGIAEMGRGVGVTREILSLFWREFSISLAIGAAEKVPSIRHDYQKNHWISIARIVVFGYRQAKYFPIFLSKAFVISSLFGEQAVTKECLFDSFKAYISKDEQEILKKCLDGQIDATDDDVLEMLSSYKCYRLPTHENINVIVEELAHQELIQKPKYMATAWTDELQALKCFPEFCDACSLYTMHEEKIPASKRVIKLLHAEPSSEAERMCFDHLKRFIKSLSDSKLAGFLQFVTGSNVITVNEIEVAFNTSVGHSRSIVAHTCAPILEIPSTFQTYNELSEQFSNILLISSAWSFDIV